MGEAFGGEVHCLPGARALFLSGYTSDIIDHHGMLQPDIESIHKPFSVEALLRKVRQVLDRRA